MIIEGSTDQKILVFFCSVIGHVIKLPGIRHSDSRDVVVYSAAKLRRAIQLPTEIRGPCSYMKLVMGQVVLGLEPTQICQIVELLVGAGDLEIIVECGEV